MVDDPRDPAAFRLAIAFLGLAVVVALGGIAWVCAEHWCARNIPNELWFMGAAIGGVFVGALIPFSLQKRKDPPPTSGGPSLEWAWEAILGGAALVLGSVVAGIVAAINDWLVLGAIGATIGAVALGLLIPSPGRRDP